MNMAHAVITRKWAVFKFKNCMLTPVANYSTDVLTQIENPNLSNVKRGTGYRSSYNGILCTVFGATGFLGRNVVGRLGNHGTQVIVPYRSENFDVQRAKCAGDLGQILFTPFWLEDDESIKRAMKYSDVVVNLIGKDHDTMNFSLEKVHIEGARKIAKFARELGVKKLIHVSTMGASPNPREIVIKGGSRLMKAKWHGEQAVREEFPDAIIVRPAEMYGDNDHFFSYYGKRQRLIWRKLYLWKLGLETIKQPVYVCDAAAGIGELVTRPNTEVAGKVYQFVGPRRYLLYDLCQYIYGWMWKDEEDFGFCIEDSRFSLIHEIYSEYRNWFFADPIIRMSRERFEREHTTDTLDPNALRLQDLGIEPQNIEDLIRNFVYIYRAAPTYEPQIFEFVPPPPAPTVPETY